jgi:hypothetical protein
MQPPVVSVVSGLSVVALVGSSEVEGSAVVDVPSGPELDMAPVVDALVVIGG